METWPEDKLPLPTYNFDVETEYSNIRSKMDSGRVRQRPRFTEELELVKVRFDLDKQQWSTFKAFFSYRLNQGNDWFTMNLPVANNESLTLVEVRFVSDLKSNLEPFENWNVSAVLEYRNSTKISELGLDILLIYNGDEQQFIDEVALLEQWGPYDWEYGP